MARYLQARGDHYQPHFVRHDTGRGQTSPAGTRYRLTTQTIWNVVKGYSRAIDGDASPHDFRHDKASVMLNRGAKLSEVQDILGHASPETTKKIYAHYETAYLRDAFDRYRLPPAVRAGHSAALFAIPTRSRLLRPLQVPLEQSQPWRTPGPR